MSSRNPTIRRKVMAVIMLTSITVLLLTVAGFVGYELFTFSGKMVRDLSTIGRIIARNSSAAVAFKDDKDAAEVLSTLSEEPQVVAAALYDINGAIFVSYPAQQPLAVPRTAETRGYRFTSDGFLLVFEPVIQNDARLGTVCLMADMRAFYQRLQIYAVLSAIIIIGSLLVALILSSRLQRRISDPILALAGTARQISKGRDFSVRAERTTGDEVGLLTDAFNQMLTQIQEQTVALQGSEARLRLAMEASRIGTWDWNMRTGRITWDSFNTALFGLRQGEFGGGYIDFLSLVHPDDRTEVEQAATRAVAEHTELSIEYRVVWRDGSVHDLYGRGRAAYDPQGKPERMNGITVDITERKRNEEASRRLAAIVQFSDDAIISKDVEGNVTSWNEGAERLLGFSAAEMVGSPITIAIPPDHHEEERLLLERIRNGERVEPFATVRQRKDGTTVDVLLTVSPIKDSQGRIIGTSAITRDITQQKRAQRELQESQTRLSGVIESAMDAIISVNSRQKITIFNAAAEKMFRCSADNALGQSLDRFIPPRFRGSHGAHVEQFGRTGVTARAMGSLRPISGLRADGEEFPIEASISQIEVGGERIYTVILRDITERIRADEALQRQARTLREQAQMLDLANVMARDLNDRVILWNTGMEKMYGWLRTEMLGHNAAGILQTAAPRPLPEINDLVLQQGHWEGELTQTRKDGRRIIVASQWVLHRDVEGRPIAVLEVNSDITGRKEAEQQILRMNTELEQRVQDRTAELTAANQEMEAFTYSVAHDLRAPLRHIDAFTRILFEDFSDQLPDEARRYLENIRKGSQNMSRLVDDLLNLARVGRQELKFELTPLNTVIDEVVAELKGETQNRHIEWDIGRLPATVSDPGLMKQVFANLLSNAVKYTRPRDHARIEVGIKRIDHEPVIFIRDNGVGFNMKYVDKLFGVFQRLHRSDEFEGTGVGLAIVERIVRRHGGRIWAESELNKGAAFYFTLEGLSKNGAPTK